MTFNIRHGEGLDDRLDLTRIASVIRAQQPDVVGLQEVDRHFNVRSEFEDQAWWLGRELGMTALYGAGLVMDPARPGLPVREYGDAILSALPVVSWAAVPLPAWPGHEGRVLVQADVESASGDIARVWSTHLAHENEEQRVEQARAISRMIGASSEPAPHVLMGDLNATPDSEVLGVLTKDLRDAWAEAGDGTPGFTFDSVRPSARIDHILTAPGVHIESIELVEVGDATDHLGLVANLAIS